MDPSSPSTNPVTSSDQDAIQHPRSPNNESHQGLVEQAPMEVVTTTAPARRPLSYPESPPLRTRPPLPVLFRLLPVSRNPPQNNVSDGEMSDMSANSPSPIRPDNLPFYPTPLNVYRRSASPESREPSLEPEERENAIQTTNNETPAPLPPETPFTQMMDTPGPIAHAQTPQPYRDHGAVTQVRGRSEPPAERSQQIEIIQRPPSPPSIKTETRDVPIHAPVTTASPDPADSQLIEMETSPAAASTPGPLSTLAPSPNQTLVPTRRMTRGFVAAAAAATSEAAPRRSVLQPGAPIQASITTWIITNDRSWVLPAPRLGVSLAQIVPADVEAPAWMKFTRAPIVWDGKTDAGEYGLPALSVDPDRSGGGNGWPGGKSGRNLVLIGAAAAKVAVNGRLVNSSRNESADGGSASTSLQASTPPLEGLHLLMDYRADEKPSYSYALITRFAILGSPFKSLSLGEIYIMLEAKFPWFARDDSKWRDSIRYNLSSNCWFVKTKRALHQPGVGNLWMVDEESTGGPKRPRKGRGKGSAFMDADEEDEESGDEPGPSIISSVDGVDPNSPPTSRNGTLMLTFDSKAKVPLDRTQGQRGITAHANHNLIPRIVTRQIVMSAVDEAFASPSSSGEPHMDPREKAVQALNNVPFSLSSGDPREEARLRGKSLAVVTRAAAKEEQRNLPPKNEYQSVPMQSTPAPPWLSSGTVGNGDNTNDEGIGSGRDDEESLDADAEGLTPEDYWTEPTSATAEANPQGPEEYHQMEDMIHSEDVHMEDRPTPMPAAPVDFSGLQSLSDAALNENQTREKLSQPGAPQSQAADNFLIRGKELPPAVINGVVVRRRQANYLDDKAFFLVDSAPPKPSVPPPVASSANVQPPSFASIWDSANTVPPQRSVSASTPAATGSLQVQGRSMFGSAKAQGGLGFQSSAFGSTRHPLDVPKRTAEPPATTAGTVAAARKRPQLAKLAPAATSSSGTTTEPGRGDGPTSQFRIPFSITTPPSLRRSLTPNPPQVDKAPSGNSLPISPYAPPPDSRKRKTIPQSPKSNDRNSSDPRQQKVRRIEISIERKKVNKINPIFATGQNPDSAATFPPYTSSKYALQPVHGKSSRHKGEGSKMRTGIGFATPTTGVTYAVPGNGGPGSFSTQASASKELTGPVFGQSDFGFKAIQPSGPSQGGSGKPGGSNAFMAFSSQSRPPFRATVPPAAPSSPGQESADSMDLDSEEELPSREVTRRARYTNRMELDAYNRERGEKPGHKEPSTTRREADLYEDRQSNPSGMSAERNNRVDTSLSVSVPVSSSRTEREPTASGENLTSPISASCESPVLPLMAYSNTRASTQSPHLPSINSLLRHSPVPDPRESLPPIQSQRTDLQAEQPAQSMTHRFYPQDHSRTRSSSSDVAGGPSTQSMHLSSRYTYYYGFIIANQSSARAPPRTAPAYSGGYDDDYATTIFRTDDWRD